MIVDYKDMWIKPWLSPNIEFQKPKPPTNESFTIRTGVRGGETREKAS